MAAIIRRMGISDIVKNKLITKMPASFHSSSETRLAAATPAASLLQVIGEFGAIVTVSQQVPMKIADNGFVLAAAAVHEHGLRQPALCGNRLREMVPLPFIIRNDAATLGNLLGILRAMQDVAAATASRRPSDAAFLHFGPVILSRPTCRLAHHRRYKLLLTV